MTNDPVDRTILILSNVTMGLFNFRKELIEKLVRQYHVVIVAEDNGRTDDITKMGCEFVNISISRQGTNPIDDLRLEREYRSILKQYKPFVALTYTIKPNIYGGMACASIKIPSIANVTGLGDAIENDGIISIIARKLYKYGLKNSRKVFFQNQTNSNFFIENKLYSGDYDVLPGSGVNLDAHPFESYPESQDKNCLVVVGRITTDKGINEILEASHQFKECDLEIILIGNCEGDYIGRIKDASKEGVIKYVGRQENIHEWYKKSHAILHASYHEGMSNVLLEAASCGRPIIATNIPGCREAFDDGISGIGFEPRNIESLVTAIKTFITLPYERKREMGIAGRHKMEASFDRKFVVQKYITEIESIEGEK